MPGKTRWKPLGLVGRRIRPRGMPDKPPAERGAARVLNERLDVLVKIGLILGAIAAFYQYGVSRDDLRSARTLDHIARFEGEGLVASRHSLDDALRRATQNLESSDITPDIHRRLALMIAYDVDQGKGMINQISDLTGFFDTLQSCIEMRLCDADDAHGFFDDYAARLYSNFRPFILHYRDRSSPGYASGLEQFVEAARRRGE